jgi:hypothetical protein
MSTSPWSTEEFCYLCGERFVADVHPSRVFPPQFGGHAGGPLELKTHPGCEREFHQDEEYFFTTLLLSQPVLRPLDPGRFDLIPGTDYARVCRVLWKIARGIFSHHYQRFVPLNARWRFFILAPFDGAAGRVNMIRPSRRAQYGDYEFGLPIGKVEDPNALDHSLCICVWETYQLYVWLHYPDCVCGSCSGPAPPYTITTDS